MLTSLIISLVIFAFGIIFFLVLYLKNRKAPRKTGKHFFSIDNIQEGILEVSGSYCRILKLSPVNYYLLTPDEKQAFEHSLMDVLRSLNVPFQVFSTARAVDARGPAEQMRIIAGKEKGVRAEYAWKLASILEATVRHRALRARDAHIIVSGSSEEEVNANALQVASAFSRARVNLVSLNSEETADLLYEVMNRDPLFKPSLAVAKGALEDFTAGKGVVANVKPE